MTKLKFKELEYHHFLMAKKIVRKEGEIQIQIQGRSMIPLYEPNGEEARVLYLQTLGELKRFDIVVFWQDNILISHYFWKANKYFNEDLNNPTLVTRPLNPIKAFDHPIHFEQILGIIRERKISFWLKIRIYLNLFFK